MIEHRRRLDDPEPIVAVTVHDDGGCTVEMRGSGFGIGSAHTSRCSNGRPGEALDLGTFGIGAQTRQTESRAQRLLRCWNALLLLAVRYRLIHHSHLPERYLANGAGTPSATCRHARVDHDLGAGNCLCARDEHDDGCPCPSFTERPRA